MRYFWNGLEARVGMSDQECDYIKSIGFIEVPGFEPSRPLPTQDQVKEMIAGSDAEYETKDMKPKKRKLKGDEGDK